MSFLDNLFKNDKKSEVIGIEDVKSYMINDMEKKWKMHVKEKASLNQKLLNQIYAIQIIKYEDYDRVLEAKNIYEKSMTYGLFPLYYKEEIDIEITLYFDINILFLTNNDVIIYTHLGSEEEYQFITSIKTDLQHIKEEYKCFIEEIHKKVFLSNSDIENNFMGARMDISFAEINANYLTIESRNWVEEYDKLKNSKEKQKFYDRSSGYFKGSFKSHLVFRSSLTELVNNFIQIIDSGYLELTFEYENDLLWIYNKGFIDIQKNGSSIVCSVNEAMKKLLAMSFYEVPRDYQDYNEAKSEHYKIMDERFKSNNKSSSSREAILNNFIDDDGINSQDEYGNTLLISAVKLGDIYLLKDLIKLNTDINIRNKDSKTALQIALEMEYSEDNTRREICIELINHCDTTRWNNYLDAEYALINASYFNNIDIVKKLINAGMFLNFQEFDSNDESSLHKAVMNDNIEIVKLLIDAGSNLDLQTDDIGETALLMAVRLGHVEAAKLLIKAGANININTKYNNLSVMSWAEAKGYDDVIYELKKVVANV